MGKDTEERITINFVHSFSQKNRRLYYLLVKNTVTLFERVTVASADLVFTRNGCYERHYRIRTKYTVLLISTQKYFVLIIKTKQVKRTRNVFSTRSNSRYTYRFYDNR